MIDISEDFKHVLMKLKEWLRLGLRWSVEYKLHLYLGAVLFLVALYIGYEDIMRQWYNKHIVDTILSKFRSNIAFQLVLVLGVMMSCYDIIRKHKYAYRYDERLIFILLISSSIMIYYRCSDLYEYVLWVGEITYIDVFSFIGITYVAAAAINILDRKRPKPIVDQENKSSLDFEYDFPIENKADDVLEWELDLDNVIKKIHQLRTDRAGSIAIVGQWGAGKTSFVNLIKERLESGGKEQENFEILCFNPRTSRSIENIQEDFFTLLANVLNKYDSRFGHTIKDYMSALQLIDNRGIIAKLTNFYEIWDKVSLKEKLESSLKQIKKRILVIIDDFDRLSREEIFEVLKLIDNNAAFPNLVFLTAYDKQQVNTYLGTSHNTADACFIDKFFNMEFYLPKRPYRILLDYLTPILCQKVEQISQRAGERVDESEAINNAVGSLKMHLQEFLPTLRDVKRFINQFVLDYEQVQGEVYFRDFLGVQLIKYKYPEEYKKLYRKEYLEQHLANMGVYSLKKQYLETSPIGRILETLFPSTENSVMHHYRHIRYVRHFDYYFVNQIYGTLLIKDMKRVFLMNESKAIAQINEWMDNQHIGYFIDYLNTSIDGTLSIERYKRYILILAYISVKLPQGQAIYILIYLVNFHYIERDKILESDVERSKCKEVVLSIVLDTRYDKDLHLSRRLHRMFKTGELNGSELLIQDKDIWPAVKEGFISRLEEGEVNRNIIQWLYDCIDSKEEVYRLDKDCLSKFRAYLTKHPQFYIQDFVRLDRYSTNSDFNSVACEPFWKQIFSNAESFEAFVKECQENKVPYIDRVANFWRLYKANDMKPIEFDGQGDVQDKIDSDLVHEVRMLEELQDIQRQIEEITTAGNSQTRQIELQQLRGQLENVQLYISLRRNLVKLLDDLLSSQIQR